MSAIINFIENLIKREKPEYIFHLAANSTTRHDALFENHKTISTGTLNILESVKRHSPGSRVFITVVVFSSKITQDRYLKQTIL